jgi:hypothetical protein
VLGHPVVEALCGAIGFALLVVVIWSGLFGEQIPSDNFAPTFVYVAFWIGLVPISVLFGDLFRAFNPWRAAARAVSWVTSKVAGERLPAPLAYPERWGRWPAAVGLLLFAWLELANPSGSTPETVARAAFFYSAATWVAMSLVGIEPWLRRGETFSVYFDLFARLSPLERRDGVVGVRRPLSGLLAFDPQVPGTVAFIAAMIGTVTFDGASEGALWADIRPELNDLFDSIGLSTEVSSALTATVGLLVGVALVAGLYRLGVAGAHALGGDLSARRLARAFSVSLVPIALAYVGLTTSPSCSPRARRSRRSCPIRSGRAGTCSGPPRRRSTTG